MSGGGCLEGLIREGNLRLLALGPPSLSATSYLLLTVLLLFSS